MASREFKQVEDILYDYPKLESEIAKRRLSIRVPHRESGESVGGKSNIISRPQESYVINLERDKRLKILEEHLEVATEVLETLDPSEYEVIRLYYFQRPRRYTWEGVAQKTGYSKRQCYRIRDTVVTSIGRTLGYLD